MRIGICINRSWNIYNFRRGLVQALLDDGHEVIAIAPSEPAYNQKLIEMGCEFVPVEMEAKGSNPLQDFKLTAKLRKAYQQAKLDIVLQYTIKPNIYGTLAAKSLGIAAINNVTGLGTVFIRKNLTARAAYLLYKLSFRFPKKVFFQNQDDRNLFLEMGLVNKKITGLLPGSGVNLQYFTPSPTKREEPFRFLMIARLLYDKGIVEYVEASRILKSQGINCVCQILGRVETDAGLGVTEQQVKSWEEEGLIQYLGLSDDVRKEIRPAHCVVLPSYREGTPRTMLESSSMSKPLVATDVAGCRETVEEGYNGYLCEVKNPASLAEAMSKVYHLEEKALEEMGNNSRKMAENKFDEQLVINAYKQAIQD